MKAFAVMILFLFLILIFLTSAFSGIDLTPDNATVVQGAQQPAPIIPLAPTPGTSSAVPQQQSLPANANVPGVQVLVPAGGIPVTGGTAPCATGTCPTSSIPVTGTCGVQYIPVTGGCGVTYIPVTGFPVTGIPVTGYCSNPYVVNRGDTLSRIARSCGTSVPGILALNPTISNANLIYPGQVIWLYAVTTTQPSVPVTGDSTTPTATVPVNPVVLDPAAMPIPAGTKLQVSVSNFPANTPVNIGIGRPGSGYQVVNSAITDANGFLQTTAVVPSTENTQEQWIVMVVTMNTPLIQSQSAPFTIGPAQ